MTKEKMIELPEKDAAALATLTDLCAEQGLLKRVGFKDGDRPDGVTDETALLRFLQANQMVPSNALLQFQEATKFQTANSVLRLYNLINVDDFEDTRGMYPHWTGRRDNQGWPIVMLDLAYLNQATIAHWRKTRDIPHGCHDCDDTTNVTANMAQRACVVHDYLTRFVFPLCSAMPDRPNPSSPISKSIYILDASPLSLGQVWNLRDFAQEISWILSTCYPETIERIFMCNVPSYFAQLWAIAKRFVHPVTADKIQILREGEVYDTLSTRISHENIPSQFGGNFKFINGMVPDLEPAICQTLRWSASNENLPSGPIKWTEDSSGQMKAVATGTANGKQRTEEVAVLELIGSS